MDGLLIIDKLRGWSSHDVVARARRLLREKRIGHAGTLDPMATGVLVLCIGQATRLSEYLLGEDKSYVGIIKLGERTHTDDAEGEVIASRAVPHIGDEDLRRLEAQFTGEIAQVPPQFSAIQKGGQRAYARARKGEAVALEPRRVVVYEIRLSPPQRPAATDEAQPMMDDPFEGLQSSVADRSPSGDHLLIRVRCSAGTYIRALARDIGEALGCGGHLVALRRTQSGRFTLADAITLAQLEQAAGAGEAAALLLPMDRAVSDWPAVHLSDDPARRLRMGQAVQGCAPSAAPAPDREVLARVYDSRGTFIAIARWDGMKLSPVKVFDAAHPFVR